MPERDAVFTPRWGISSWHRSLPAASERSKPPSFTSASFASRKLKSLPQSIQPVWSHRHSQFAAQVKAAARLSCFEIWFFLRSGAAAESGREQWVRDAPRAPHNPTSGRDTRGAETSPRAPLLPSTSSCSGRAGPATRSFSPPAGTGTGTRRREALPAALSRPPPRAVRYRFGRGAAPGAGPATCCSSAPEPPLTSRTPPASVWAAAGPSRCKRRAPPHRTARLHSRRGWGGEGGERRGWTPAVSAVRERAPWRVF